MIFELRNGWRAGYIKRCKSGSEGGSRKPDPEMGKGAGFLPYVLCYAPTRSGKGISLVLPTLLDGWKQSVFVLDIKQENCKRKIKRHLY
jgi:hypothetical protein